LESGKRSPADELMEILERADTAYSAYRAGIVPEKREMVDSVTSNRLLSGKSLEVSLNSPFDLIADRFKMADGRARRDIHRTWDRLLQQMLSLLEEKTKKEKAMVV
jgi:hypothetical protein